MDVCVQSGNRGEVAHTLVRAASALLPPAYVPLSGNAARSACHLQNWPPNKVAKNPALSGSRLRARAADLLVP